MRGRPCILVIQKGLSGKTGLGPASGDGLSVTHLTFLWPSDEDTGPVERVGFRFLGRPGPRLAGLRGVSSFLFAHTDVDTKTNDKELRCYSDAVNAERAILCGRWSFYCNRWK